MKIGNHFLDGSEKPNQLTIELLWKCIELVAYYP